ncbi:hypothetical protein EJB05_36933, partial [Eragrostis curvula]
MEGGGAHGGGHPAGFPGSFGGGNGGGGQFPGGFHGGDSRGPLQGWGGPGHGMQMAKGGGYPMIQGGNNGPMQGASAWNSFMPQQGGAYGNVGGFGGNQMMGNGFVPPNQGGGFPNNQHVGSSQEGMRYGNGAPFHQGNSSFTPGYGGPTHGLGRGGARNRGRGRGSRGGRNQGGRGGRFQETVTGRGQAGQRHAPAPPPLPVAPEVANATENLPTSYTADAKDVAAASTKASTGVESSVSAETRAGSSKAVVPPVAPTRPNQAIRLKTSVAVGGNQWEEGQNSNASGFQSDEEMHMEVEEELEIEPESGANKGKNKDKDKWCFRFCTKGHVKERDKGRKEGNKKQKSDQSASENNTQAQQPKNSKDTSQIEMQESESVIDLDEDDLLDEEWEVNEKGDQCLVKKITQAGLGVEASEVSENSVLPLPTMEQGSDGVAQSYDVSIGSAVDAMLTDTNIGGLASAEVKLQGTDFIARNKRAVGGALAACVAGGDEVAVRANALMQVTDADARVATVAYGALVMCVAGGNGDAAWADTPLQESSCNASDRMFAGHALAACVAGGVFHEVQADTPVQETGHDTQDAMLAGGAQATCAVGGNEDGVRTNVSAQDTYQTMRALQDVACGYSNAAVAGSALTPCTAGGFGKENSLVDEHVLQEPGNKVILNEASEKADADSETPSLALGPLLEKALKELKESKGSVKDRTTNGSSVEKRVTLPSKATTPIGDLSSPLRRSSRRAATVDEDSAERASRLVAKRNLETIEACPGFLLVEKGEN